MKTETNWLLKDFCERVNDLKKKGVDEEYAKTLVKHYMESAISILKGDLSFSDAIIGLPETPAFYKPTNNSGV